MLNKIAMFDDNNVIHSTDASFGRKNWEEKKNEVVNYFNGPFAGRVHLQYIGQYIGCKVLSIALIVSIPASPNILNLVI